MGRLRRRTSLSLAALVVAGVLTALAPGTATAAPPAPERPRFQITTVASGLTIPWDVAQAPDGTLIFNQRGGGLSVRRANGTVAPLSADFSDIYAVGETGLMGLELDPGFATNRRFYTCQGHQAGGAREIQVIAWTVNSGYTAATRVADPLVGGLPVSSGRHGGCRLRFDTTGALMVATGDAAIGTNPQDLTSLGGKILRVNPATGAPAAGNPRLGATNPNTRLIFNYGHRNPQGLALRPNGQMFNAEHGSFRDDEVNLVLPDRNYGWDPVPGYNEQVPMTDLAKFPNAQPALFSSGPTTDAVSGATFLVGPQWKAWDGSLVVAQLAGTSLRRLAFDSSGQVLTSDELIPEFTNTYGRLRTAQLGADGSLYITTSNGGGTDVILKVTPESAPVTYVTRMDGSLSSNLTTAFLNQVYDCTLEPSVQTNYRPLLPQSGSSTRSTFLQSIGLTDSADFTARNPCVSDRDPTNPAQGLPENTGNRLTDPRHLAPYSIAQYQAQITGAITDVTRRTVLRNLDGIAPTVRNPAAPDVTYATRLDSNLSRNLTTAQLKTVYTDSAPCLLNYRPLLPTSGSATRTAFLAQLGISEAEVGKCVSSQSAAGQPVSENNGTVLSDPRNLVPYSIAAYLSQPGVRGETILRNLDRIVPTVPNT